MNNRIFKIFRNADIIISIVIIFFTLGSLIYPIYKQRYNNMDIEVIAEENSDVTLTFNNITKSDEKLVYAWYIYEITEGNESIVTRQMYSDNQKLFFDYHKEKVYRIKAFIRDKEKKDKVFSSKVVAEVRYDFFKNKFNYKYF